LTPSGVAGLDWRQALARRIRALRREARAVAQTPAVACTITRRRLERGEPVPQWLWTAALAEVRAIRARTAELEPVARAWEQVARNALGGSL